MPVQIRASPFTGTYQWFNVTCRTLRCNGGHGGDQLRGKSRVALVSSRRQKEAKKLVVSRPISTRTYTLARREVELLFAPLACIKDCEVIDDPSSFVANGDNVVDTRQICFGRVDPGLLLWLWYSGLVDYAVFTICGNDTLSAVYVLFICAAAHVLL
jgi:hypothetical protein